MWEYNYDYLSHGLRGYKYIERKRGKNGKWQYVYPDSAEGERIDAGRRVEEGINHPLTNPNRALLYGRTPGASVPKTKPSIARNGKASDNTVTTTSSKTGTSSKEAVKNLGTEIAGKFKDAYDETLGSEDFKKYKKYEALSKDEKDKIYNELWRAMSNAVKIKGLTMPEQEVIQNKKAIGEIFSRIEKEYGSAAKQDLLKVFDDYKTLMYQSLDTYYSDLNDSSVSTSDKEIKRKIYYDRLENILDLNRSINRR